MTDPSANSTPAETLKEAARIARIQLGPSSAALLAKPQYQSILLSRIARMQSLEDAVFAVVFEFGRNDQEISNEFFGSFLAILYAKGRRLAKGGVDNFIGSQDLVQSVIGDLLAGDFQFQGRAQLLAYLDRGMRWKASAARDSAAARSHRDVDPLELDTQPTTKQEHPPGPLTEMAFEEERELLALGMQRLEPHERELLQLHLAYKSLAEIAEATGRSLEATRSALARAKKKVLAMFPGQEG